MPAPETVLRRFSPRGSASSRSASCPEAFHARHTSNPFPCFAQVAGEPAPLFPKEREAFGSGAEI